ncbi:uncharacterized protein LOC108103977 [Drosophila eugracilis]|uniref:uncharacterized protein LOC108103977 n=1 Tax=Drosophila eugracilis TaxID=29029 RepID=UPI0007E71471|nr:uncharacterized protein LOC108103977 [Drosophila eugracilis]
MLSAAHSRCFVFSALWRRARVLSQQQTRNKSSKTVEVYRDASKNLSFDVVAVRCSSCCCFYSVLCSANFMCIYVHICIYICVYIYD